MKYYVEMSIVDCVEVEADDEYEAVEKAKLELGPRVADDWQLTTIDTIVQSTSLEDFLEMADIYKKEEIFGISRTREKQRYCLTIYYLDYFDTPLGDSIEFENSDEFYFDDESDLNFAYEYMLRKLY